MKNIIQQSKKRILYVESHEDNRLLMIPLMQQIGCDCMAVTTSDEGLQLARSEQFDLYILDSWLTDGTGIELCKQIREFDKVTPILFFSAWTPRPAQEEAIAAGANAYVLKPAIDVLMFEVLRRLTNVNSRAEYLMLWSLIPACSCQSGPNPGGGTTSGLSDWQPFEWSIE